jgi:hypothetical protein
MRQWGSKLTTVVEALQQDPYGVLPCRLAKGVEWEPIYGVAPQLPQQNAEWTENPMYDTTDSRGMSFSSSSRPRTGTGSTASTANMSENPAYEPVDLHAQRPTHNNPGYMQAPDYATPSYPGQADERPRTKTAWDRPEPYALARDLATSSSTDDAETYDNPSHPGVVSFHSYALAPGSTVPDARSRIASNTGDYATPSERASSRSRTGTAAPVYAKPAARSTGGPTTPATAATPAYASAESGSSGGSRSRTSSGSRGGMPSAPEYAQPGTAGRHGSVAGSVAASGEPGMPSYAVPVKRSKPTLSAAAVPTSRPGAAS